MKKISILLAFCLFLGVQESALSQVVEKAVEKATEKKIEEGLNKLFGTKKKKKTQEKEVVQEEKTQPPETTVEGEVAAGPSLNWSKYDFVPGPDIIFEDNLEGEENGEFPSRWDLVQGTTENAEFGGEKVIMFRGGSPMIVPYLKNSDIDYLPEVFTVEFDLYLNNRNTFQVYFYDRKNQRASSAYRPLSINYHEMNLSPASSRIPDNGTIDNSWAHISIAYTNGKMKAYINETRLINIPHLEFDPMGISLYAYHASDNYQFFVKNFRLAKGGVKYYDRFLQDGKIVSNGIRFDTGKSSLRPESMGVLNEIYKMLTDHPEIKLSIEGHTDNVGDAELNQKLSEERAGAVVQKLVSMGISPERLTFKGYGENNPVDSNDTPEGKASNRRVEFVKQG